MNVTTRLLLLPWLLTASFAQQPATAPIAQDRAPTRLSGVFRVPIHSHAPDPVDGEYGLWASGDDFKVSFHDGFEFHPVLGNLAPRNLPLRWTTTRVTCGGELLVAPGRAVPQHSEWHCEYRHGPVTEAYDVLADGVEQTFVVARRPAGDGDLVVEGRIDSPLHAEPVAAAVQELLFVDADGTPRVRYGAAAAIDAGGRRCAVTTAFDGQHVRLTVPAEWLVDASYPLTIDPVTAAVPFSVGPAQFATMASVCHQAESVLLDTAVAYVRPTSAIDYDLAVHVGPRNLQSSTLMFTDVGNGFSSLTPDIAYVGGADRWVVAFWKQYTTGEDRLRIYFHDRDNSIMNSGLTQLHNPVGEHVAFTVVGGSSNPVFGTHAAIAYRMDLQRGDTASSEIHSVFVDAATRQITGHVVVDAGHDAENPQINSQRGEWEDGWIVTFAARDSITDDFDVYACRVSAEPVPQVSARVRVGPDDLGDKGGPVVAGQDGRYLVVMGQDGITAASGQFGGRNLLSVRLDWASQASQPTIAPHRTVVTSPVMDLERPSLAFDTDTRSHWCLVYDDQNFGSSPRGNFRRLGHQGAVVETGDIGTPRYGLVVGWNATDREFQIVSCGNDSNGTVWAQRLVRPPAQNVFYGTACGTADFGATVPLAGNENYRVNILNAPPSTVGALVCSFAPGSISLAAIGAPGCTMNLANTDVWLPLATDLFGLASYRQPLPDAPLFVGDLHWQFVYLDPTSSSPLPIGATRGLRAEVR